jgi:large repetitive protein
VTITEGDTGTTTATFNVTLSATSGKTVTFDWATSAGSATAGTDYVTASSSRTIAAGATTATVGITVNGDVLDEVNESFNITLSNPGNATISDGSGVGTITDDDLPPTLSVNDVTLAEGDTGTTTATFNVTLSAASAKAVTLDWTTVDGSAVQPADFTADSGTLTFVAGDTTEAVPVTVNGDVLDEVNESFNITLSNPGNATISDGSGVGTITDDDPLPVLVIADASLPEGNVGTANAQFDVTLSAASSKTVTVDWATVDDSAFQPSDYTATSGTLTFVAGDTSGSILVPVNGDGIAELDESFLVSLSGPSNADLADTEGVGTIVDDELLPVIDIDEPTVAEGQSGTGPVSFSVTLSHPAGWPVTVDWSTSDGTAAGGSDYVDESGTVTFPANDTSKTVEVTLNGDGTYERDETVALDLSNATGAPIGDVQGIATITNDDDEPTVSLANGSVTEGNAGTSHLEFVVSLSAVSGVDASIDFATADGTATGGSDYVAATGSLSIPAGETTGVVDVAVKGDLAYEGNESLSVSLSTPTDAVIGDAVAQGTITNDDKAPTTATLRTVKKPRTLLAKGILEPAKSGDRVTATLFRKRNGRFVRVAAKRVPVRSFRDRDGDGKTDGSYTATFLRPKAGGTYRILVRFKGNSTEKPCKRVKLFKLRRA